MARWRRSCGSWKKARIRTRSKNSLAATRRRVEWTILTVTAWAWAGRERKALRPTRRSRGIGFACEGRRRGGIRSFTITSKDRTGRETVIAAGPEALGNDGAGAH